MHYLRIFSLFFFLTLIFSHNAFAAPVLSAPAEVSQGRAFVVSIEDNAPFEGTLSWRGKQVPVSATLVQKGDDLTWQAQCMLAVPEDGKGVLPVVFQPAQSSGQEKLEASVAVLSVNWPKQTLQVDTKYVEPPKEVQAQIERDRKRNSAVIATISPEKMWELPFERPVKGGISSVFGGRRVFNGQERAPHKGTDMRGATGTPIKAIADGVVRIAEPQYFSGNVVYVDHGQGVISLYCHMSVIRVQEGDRVEKGQVLGEVGATGRVTGPHLHLGVNILGDAVDALPLFENELKVVGGPSKEDPKPQQNTAKK